MHSELCWSCETDSLSHMFTGTHYKSAFSSGLCRLVLVVLVSLLEVIAGFMSHLRVETLTVVVRLVEFILGEYVWAAITKLQKA